MANGVGGWTSRLLDVRFQGVTVEPMRGHDSATDAGWQAGPTSPSQQMAAGRREGNEGDAGLIAGGARKWGRPLLAGKLRGVEERGAGAGMGMGKSEERD